MLFLVNENFSFRKKLPVRNLLPFLLLFITKSEQAVCQIQFSTLSLSLALSLSLFFQVSLKSKIENIKIGNGIRLLLVNYACCSKTNQTKTCLNWCIRLFPKIISTKAKRRSNGRENNGKKRMKIKQKCNNRSAIIK